MALKGKVGFLGLVLAAVFASTFVAAPVAPAYAAGADIYYNCIVPEFGETNCGNSFTLAPDNTVEVCITSSGNNDGATFRLRQVSNNAELASKGINSGQCSGIIYQNKTGSNQAVFFTADSYGFLVRTQYQGVYKVR